MEQSSISQINEQQNNYRAGFVSIVGPANSGKSTLLNTICNTKLSAISQRPHTTRQHIKGIITTDRYQIIFIDTPGFINPKTKLEKLMYLETKRAAREDADILLLCLEPSVDILQKNKPLIETYLSLNKKTFCVITKIDIYEKHDIENAKEIISNMTKITEFIEISAVKNINIEFLKEKIISNLPFSPPYYFDNILSDKWERYFVSELIRETVFELYEEEIPYSVAVTIQAFREDTNPLYILAYIYVSKESHKGIIIGERGRMIGTLRERSQKKISEFLGKDVKLELHVKVKENWQDNEKFLKNILDYSL